MGGELSLCLAGASVSNGNRGVEALGRSVLDAVEAVAGGGRLSLFDDGWGVREDRSGRYVKVHVEHVGVRVSRRWHRPESWAQIQMAQRLGARANPVARRLAEADAVLDISGGDSFTDIYGPRRFRAIAAPKEAALRARRPLVLLPQTYGPFRTEESRQAARRLVNAAALAYARDTDSFRRLVELDGSAGDSARLHNGVDVAFALESQRPAGDIADEVESLAAEAIVGVNVSGLLRNPHAGEQFGLAGDYIGTLTDLVAELVARGTRVMLVPHVHVPGAGGESDLAAINDVLERLPTVARGRIITIPAELGAAELKWCIGRCSWFVGTRMHSTIGALSSGVPAFGYAYSLKTKGVFETCGMGEYVADAREIAGRSAVKAMLDAFDDRERGRQQLARHLPPVVERAKGQLREILTQIAAWRDRPLEGVPGRD